MPPPCRCQNDRLRYSLKIVEWPQQAGAGSWTMAGEPRCAATPRPEKIVADWRFVSIGGRYTGQSRCSPLPRQYRYRPYCKASFACQGE